MSSRPASKRLISKSDLLTLLPQGKKRLPVQVMVEVNKGSITFKSLGMQMPSFKKVLQWMVVRGFPKEDSQKGRS